ncbi:MAG: anaerobic sulfite reductase subunit AsrA [Clostridia bacterium]|nr:anaerobic sulfite reductase subunit AsrA [Clostridia bacterium]
MGYTLSAKAADGLLEALRKDYRVYAPKRFPKQGRYSDTNVIRYAEVEKFGDIVWDVKSDYPAKEVITPIQQAIFYFTEDEYRASKAPTKPILILARPCDINAQEIQAQIYAGNGGYTDLYYQRVKDLVKFAVMECGGGDDTCFCCSMGSNKTDRYALGLKFRADGVDVEVKDEAMARYFDGAAKSDYTVSFVEENPLKVTLPDLEDKAVRQALKSHPMWKEYDKRCVSCGSCTVACSTCTCFTTRDVCYGDNPEVGERRRVSASCQIEGFDQMAGQKEFRSTAGDRMRYKVLHKFHDYKARFGERHMCVGCGRCTHRCPEFISISATVNKVNDAVLEIKSGMTH